METEYVDDEDFAWLERVCQEAEAKRQRRNSDRKILPPSVTAPIPEAPLLPVISFADGRIAYLDDVDGIASAASRLSTSAATTVGFDIEWRVTYQKGAPPRPVALIQLCFKDLRLPEDAQYTCFLLHVCRCPSGLPAPLAALLANPGIAKVGVGINQDAHKLKNDFGVDISMGGMIDLSEYANARLADPAADTLPQKWSLSSLTERVLKHRLLKPQSLRCSNWEQHPLTTEQMGYAATDAWVSLRLWEELEKLPVAWDPKATAPPATAPPCAGAAAKPADPAATTVASNGAAKEALPAPKRDMRAEMQSRTPAEEVPVGIVPASRAPAALQPAKKAVLAAHLEGTGIVEIALSRRIQPATVMGYLAECIVGGHPYGWGWLEREMPAGAVALAARVAAEALKVSERPEGKAQCIEMPDEHEKMAALLTRYYAPVDLLAEVVAAKGQRLKDLQAEMEAELPGLGYGELRLAFAHLGRCKPTWSLVWDGRLAAAPQ